MIATANPAEQRGRAATSDGLDGLTGLPGPTVWRLVLQAESSRCTRYGRAATVVLVSVVGLDRLVRECDEEVAGMVVARVAKLLRSGARGSDYVARLDDRRFGILLTETGEIAAINMVERVRDRCERELATLAPGIQVAFGWASPSPSGTLFRAMTTAESRLRREAADRMAEGSA